ncbi:MAG: class II aldolase/adducin family protein [Deltaproteobacteria bacterium]|nr:MAG: class II aldolase/adducin family protein [Deltaproteobacteria bacterium]
MADLSKLREQVAQSCRMLGKLNLTKEPSGHVSARVPGEERVLIKARGPEESGLRFVSARDIITVDFNGKKIVGDDGLDVPQEVFIHTWLYKTRPDVQCVVHVHPLTVVLFTICNKPILPRTKSLAKSSPRRWARSRRASCVGTGSPVPGRTSRMQP